MIQYFAIIKLSIKDTDLGEIKSINLVLLNKFISENKFRQKEP